MLSLARVRAGTPTPRSAGGKVKIENFSASGDSQGVVEVARVVKSDEEWRAQLSPLSFTVTRHEGTERAFSGEYAANHADGPLSLHLLRHGALRFADQVRIRHRLAEFLEADFEAQCARERRQHAGDAAQSPSRARAATRTSATFSTTDRDRQGLRYCMNSVALNFVPRAGKTS